MRPHFPTYGNILEKGIDSAKMHRKVVGAIKRARTIGLMPFVDSGSE